MFSKKSIRFNFILQLVSASAVLIVIFSVILYNYIKISIYEDLTKNLKKDATIVAVTNSSDIKRLDLKNSDPHIMSIVKDSQIVYKKNLKNEISFQHSSKHNQHYLTIYYPYLPKKHLYIKITRNISDTDKLLEKILKNILMINFMAIFLILFYALFLSRMLLLPIKSLAINLANMNESFLQTIDPEKLPEEFKPLGKSINKLVERIQTFVLYQKELFIGVAHELKTPLAVMKTKNEVTLIKPRNAEKYTETIKSNNQTIDEMNKMISNILEIGRQEGAQFEEPVEIDLVAFLKERANNFKILAHQVEKIIQTDITPKEYIIKTQPTLLIHILQNFIQNAIKFTPVGKKIFIKSYQSDEGYHIEIIDEGSGIDESKDLFAPFKRYGNKSGAGLGLFLAKGAANAIGAKISVKNRSDKKGTISSLFIPNSKK